MTMTTLTLELMKKLDACKDSYKFVENNKLIGYPLNRLQEIKGDYKSYVSWLKNELNFY